MAQYDINLREYWRILKKRKSVVILLTIVLGLFSTSFAILKAPAPLFSTVCLVEIQKQPTIQGVYTQAISFSDSDDIATQVSIVKSYRVFAGRFEDMEEAQRSHFIFQG